MTPEDILKRALLLALLSLTALSPSLHAAGIPVGGRVLGPDGKPFANARVSLIPYPSIAEIGKLEIAGKTGPEPAATLTTGADGTFRLTAPGEGMWKVRVESQGHVPLEAFLLPLLEETDLPDAQLTADLRLQVKVTDAQGRPVAGARVRVDEGRNPMREPSLWRTGRRLALTDATGAAVVPRGTEESLSVRAAAPGAGISRGDRLRAGSVQMSLGAGKIRQLVVRDAKGRPAAGAVLFLGEYEMALGVTSETGLAEVVLPGGQPMDLSVAAADGRRLAWRLLPAKEGETGPAAIILPDAVPVAGKVVSAQDGRPVAGALAWSSRDYGRTVRAGADGAVRFPTLAGQEDAVSAAAPGFFEQDADKVKEGKIPTLALEPRLAASGVVVDEAGRPVPGAALQASPLPGPRMQSMSRSMTLFRSGGFARSGPAGRFRLANLASGSGYELRVSRAGFAPARLEIPAREPGQPAAELRIVLREGRRVFGLVVDAGRRPVAGARVSLQATPSNDPMARLRAARNPEPPPGGATDAAGRFEVRNLPAGSYDLQVRARGFARLTVPGLAVPEGTGGTDLGTVMLAPGLSLRGLVNDAQGRPVEGAEVRARPAARDEMMIFDRDPGPADAVTAADGSFTLEDRSPGESLDLSATRAGYGPGLAPGVAVPSEEPVRIVLDATARVSGRTVDPQGKPVPGASIFLSEAAPMNAAGRSMLGPSGRFHRAVSDEQGGFSIEDVSPGPVRLHAQAPRRQQVELENLEVKPGQGLTGLDVVLPAGATVEGRVLGPDGRPVGDARVSVVQASQNDFAAFSSLRGDTDADGHYQIDGVPPGPHTLEARADGYRRAARDVEVTERTGAVDFQLDRGLEVSGRVVDDAGAPIPGVQLTLTAGMFSRDSPGALTGADGAFRIAGVQDGTYRLRPRKEGYVSPDPLGMAVTVAGAPVSGLEVRLSAGAAIVGKISGLEFSQLSRVRVSANSSFHSGQVDPEGSYRISNLAPGRWMVTAVVPDTPLHAEGEVKIEPGVPEVRLDLQLGGGHELRGVVLSNGQPLPGAGLVLSRPTAAGMQTATSDHQGGFRFGGLEDGAYDLEVSTPRGALHRESVEMSGDREIRVELRTASLSGRVLDAQDGTPVPGVSITLKSAASEGGMPPFSDATTDARGVFRLLEIGDGAWKLRAAREGYAPAERDLQVDGSALDEMEIRIEPTEGVTVEALLPTGQAPERIRVAALGPDGKVVASGTYPTGENGRTRLTNLPPGSWSLLIDSDQSAPVLASAAVPGPAVRVALPFAGQLMVRTPEIPNGAKVVLTGSGGPYRAMDFDGAVKTEWEIYAGQRLFPRVAAGVWQVEVRTPDGKTLAGTATVTPGGMAEVVVK